VEHIVRRLVEVDQSYVSTSNGASQFHERASFLLQKPEVCEPSCLMHSLYRLLGGLLNAIMTNSARFIMHKYR
jgi:hypothetical protein